MRQLDKHRQYEYPVTVGDGSRASRLIEMIGADRRVLEVGCASGSQTQALSEGVGCSVVGIEIDPVAAAKARPYCEDVVVGDIEQLTQEEIARLGPFDVVLLADVLEHLRDPVGALRKCRSALATDGFLVASVPNVTHAAIAFELAHGRFDYRPSGLLDDTHVRFFSRASLIETFAAGGFALELLERVVVDASETEFRCAIESDADRSFFKYVLDRNLEARTYQFLARAIPIDSLAQLGRAAKSMRDQIEALENRLHSQARELRRLRSEVSWLSERPVRGFLRALRLRILGVKA